MMKIIILEDEKMFAEELKERICGLDFYNRYTPEIIICTGSEQLPESLSDVDIIFVDYKLGNETGMDVVRNIRQDNKDINVIFVTAYPEYVFDSFRVDTFRYLVKPVSDEDLAEALESYISRDVKHKVIRLPEKGKFRCFSVSSIMYLETEGRNSYVYTADEKYLSKKAINEIEELIDMQSFYRINRFYVVNFDYIDKVVNNILLLKNGRSMTISRNRREEFGKRYIKYLQSKK